MLQWQILNGFNVLKIGKKNCAKSVLPHPKSPTCSYGLGFHSSWQLLRDYHCPLVLTTMVIIRFQTIPSPDWARGLLPPAREPVIQSPWQHSSHGRRERHIHHLDGVWRAVPAPTRAPPDGRLHKQAKWRKPIRIDVPIPRTDWSWGRLMNQALGLWIIFISHQKYLSYLKCPLSLTLESCWYDSYLSPAQTRVKKR